MQLSLRNIALQVLVTYASTILVSLHHPALACEEHDHRQGLAKRSSRYATQPSGSEDLLTPLTWGDVQIVATTDIHGWYQGHLHSTQPDPNYSGDFGDFASFVTHLRTLALERGVDLLVVDSGDLHDGDGLSDGFPEGGTDGHVSNRIHSQVPYDLLSVGNHELYKYGVAYDTYQNFIPAQKGRYVSSNVNISIYDEKTGRNVSHIMGERYVKFKTAQGRRVTSLGVLFDFKGQDDGITIQSPLEMIKESWFSEAIADEPDFFLLAGHMPVRWGAWPNVVEAIRKVHKNTPILISGGHTHIRDCYVYDDNAIGIEAGRYLETIGWLSVNFTKDDAAGNVSYSRSYIDANRRNYAYHLNSPQSKLDTPRGSQITSWMSDIAAAWNLTDVYGRAPQDYFLDRYDVSSESSVVNLLQGHILPAVVSLRPSKENADRADVPRLIVANTGLVRFDLYSGNFTKNDQYIVSPFTDAFFVIRDVPYRYARQIIDQLNKGGYPSATRRRSQAIRVPASEEDMYHDESYAMGEVGPIFSSWRAEQYRAQLDQDRARLEVSYPHSQDDVYLSGLVQKEASEDPSLGYVTRDSCDSSVGNGPSGDDTLHRAIPYVPVPNYISTALIGNSSSLDVDSDVKTDVILVDFIQGAVLAILNTLQSERAYSEKDVRLWNSFTTQDVFRVYARERWADVPLS